MDVQQFFNWAWALAIPLIVAWVNGVRSEGVKQRDRINDIEREILQQRIDMQRDMVGRHEIERLSALISHLISINEQIQARLDRKGV